MQISEDKLLSLENQNLEKLILCRSDDCVSTELDGETVILDISAGQYSGLDSVGTFIWAQLAQPITIFKLRQAIMLRYEVDEEKCLVDLLAFLKDLASNHLLRLQNEKNN